MVAIIGLRARQNHPALLRGQGTVFGGVGCQLMQQERQRRCRCIIDDDILAQDLNALTVLRPIGLHQPFDEHLEGALACAGTLAMGSNVVVCFT